MKAPCNKRIQSSFRFQFNFLFLNNQVAENTVCIKITENNSIQATKCKFLSFNKKYLLDFLD